MVTVKIAVVLPPALLAVIAYGAKDVALAGVPVITPVVVFKLNPVGRAGDTEYDATVPLLLGVLEAIKVPAV